ncbi:TPA: hypothetical protein QFM54_001852 [Enterococcus faecium]
MQKMKKILMKCIRSKLVVVMAILSFWAIGEKIQEVSAYEAGTAYQYYLLGTKSEELVEGSESTDLPLNLGSLGAGGVSGQVSYDDMVNSANSEEDKEGAKQFSATMATYSTFGYFSNKVEGFANIVVSVGRVLSGIILIPLALLMDILHTIIPTLIAVIAKLNVIPLIATMLTDLNFSSDLAKALDIQPETLTSLTNAFLSFAIVMILISLGGMFRKSGRVDQRSYSKFKGRLFSIFGIPIIIGLGASLINEVIELASENSGTTSGFSRYFIDNRSWAYNFNFAPNGEDGKDGNIVPTSENSYVDLKYNPYTNTGKTRIGQINKYSSLATSDSSMSFTNTALVLSYVSSDSFSATDFINYKGSKASQTYYGKEGGDGKVFGSYYDYANIMGDKLVDVSQSYNPSGSLRGEDGSEDRKNGQKGGYASAVDDYKSGDKLKVSPYIAWRDRFIYGTKNWGENLEKYYSEPPSYEQIAGAVGTGTESAFSNQSMFLILSTMFDETGGKYYLDAPARGILKAKASFDSNRSTYYVVSMVGSPWFTIFGVIASPIIHLVVMLAVVTAVMSLGLIEMNVKPLMAWFKGITLGDIEYSQALLVYSVGIAGTVLSLIAIPSLLATGIEYVPKLLTIPANVADASAFTPQSSLAVHGMPLIISSVIALAFGFLYIKSPSFRNKLIELFTFSWAWAKVTGERLEMQASGGIGRRVQQEQKDMLARNRFNNAINYANQNEGGNGTIKDWFGDMRDGLKEDLNIKPLPQSPFLKNNQSSTDVGGNPQQEQLLDAQDIARNGNYERAVNNLREIETNSDLSNSVQVASIDAQEGIMQFRQAPSIETYQDALDKLSYLDREVAINGGDIAVEDKIQLAKEELFNVGKTYDFDKENMSNTEKISSSEVIKENREAEDNSNSRGAGAGFVSYTTNNHNEQIANTEYETANYGGETKNIQQQVKEENNQISNQTLNQNQTQSNESNIYKTYERKEVQQLATSLGGASQNTEVLKVLNRLNTSKTENDTQKGLSDLQQTLSNLDSKESMGIDRGLLSQSLDNMLSLKNNEKTNEK